MNNPLVRSNRNSNNQNLQPEREAKAADFDNSSSIKQNEVTSVTFDTNLKISNHTRNKLQAMASIGYADTQRDAVDITLQTWIEQLTTSEQREFDLQVKTLEQRDIKRKNKK